MKRLLNLFRHKSITIDRLEAEKERMRIERLLFGRWLLVGTGESEAFWKQVKKQIDELGLNL